MFHAKANHWTERNKVNNSGGLLVDGFLVMSAGGDSLLGFARK
jgi:hypothetical protein